MLTPELEARLLGYLKEDIGTGDLTSGIMPSKDCLSEIRANEACCLAGTEEAAFILRNLGLKANCIKVDGQAVKSGDKIMSILGDSRKILSAERVCLNILGRMSGVATLCAKAREKISGENGKKALPKPIIAVTRKTVPGFQLLDKKAAQAAGCWTHRKNLGEMILIKDNHLKFFQSVSAACRRAKETGKKFEIEVASKEQALEAANAKADIIMLDNFSVQDAKKTIVALRKNGFAGQIEVSGGIALNNLEEYASIGADIISMGELTKKARIIDFSLDILNVK